MASTVCSTCGIRKFNAFFYRRSDRKAVNQPCRRCAKQKSKQQYQKKQTYGGEN